MDIRKGEGFVVEFGWLLLVFFMLLFVFPFLLQFTILFFFKKKSPNLWRKAPNALLFQRVKKEQLTNWVLWMIFQYLSGFWQLLNTSNFSFVTFHLVGNKLLLQLPQVCACCFDSLFLLSSLLKPLEKCNYWKGCTFLPYTASTLLTAVSWSYQRIGVWGFLFG